MSYDPEARRDTPLALKLKARIGAQGPISVRDYMAACLYDPEHGYYRARTAIGRDGDFITAPEISQIFGELLGLWAAVVWQQMGSPARVKLVELGPGRGTLMRDMLRAQRRVPGLQAATTVHLVETSQTLAAVQRATLDGCDVPVSWHQTLTQLTGGGWNAMPTIVIANEWLDCEPRHQVMRTETGWAIRQVSLDAQERLVFASEDIATGKTPPGWPNLHFPNAALGSVFEPMEHRNYFHAWLADRAPVASLLIDYGQEQRALGETLQAVRGHRFEHPLTSPGEADLTMQVQFQDVIDGLSWRSACYDPTPTPSGLAVEPLVTQAEFLGRLGVAERASRLMAINPSKAAAIEAGVARLMAPNGMGTRFKVLGVRSATLSPLPGFPAVGERR